MECTISSESQKQGGSRNGSGAVVHATQREKKAELVPVVFQTVRRNFGRRREGVLILNAAMSVFVGVGSRLSI
jgi:hypothetical protein